MEEQQTPAQRLLGDFAPKMVQLTDDVLFGDVWKRPGLSPRDRSLVTVAVLAATYRPDQLISHLRLALPAPVHPRSAAGDQRTPPSGWAEGGQPRLRPGSRTSGRHHLLRHRSGVLSVD